VSGDTFGGQSAQWPSAGPLPLPPMDWSQLWKDLPYDPISPF
jgi:hypothetical protein